MLRAWRNGSRAGFRCPCSKERVGSSPSARTQLHLPHNVARATDTAERLGAPFARCYDETATKVVTIQSQRSFRDPVGDLVSEHARQVLPLRTGRFLPNTGPGG